MKISNFVIILFATASQAASGLAKLIMTIVLLAGTIHVVPHLLVLQIAVMVVLMTVDVSRVTLLVAPDNSYYYYGPSSKVL
ncbi:hypothetical protein BGZ57DRAFT_936885 [Hyaloscypha finlandica]|nr:hypothetical protein BGZ57DRAFT_936885 [Hyaloscypha finlandica]